MGTATTRSSPPPRRVARSIRGRARLALPLVTALLALTAAGCLPDNASFRPGLGTSRVVGRIAPLPQAPAVPYAGGDASPVQADWPIIVAYKYHHTFITLGDTQVRYPTAHTVLVERDGSFSIDMPSDVVSMDILFIAAGRLTDTFSFRRQIGMGDITYRPEMPEMGDWASHFYTFLAPQLEHAITEERYRMSPLERARLGDWLSAQEDRLAAARARRKRTD